MKVALTAQVFDESFGGLERWTTDFARFLAGRGHDVHVVADDGLDVPGISLHRTGPHRTDWGRAWAQARVLRGLRAVTHDTGLGWSGDVFQPQTGSRLGSLDREIATHSRLRQAKAAISPRTQSRRAMMALLERAQRRRARVVIAVSDRVRSLLIGQGVESGRIRIVRNGTDPARFTAAALDPLREAARRYWGVRPGQTLFVSVAHNLLLKGLDSTLRALARLRAEGSSARLVVAGGLPEPAMLALAGEHVTFAGFCPDIAPLFAAADAFIHPSRWDACSVSTLEALASRLPVVTTAWDGASDRVREDCGVVLPNPEDVTALTDAMRRLDDAGHRAQMAAALCRDPPDVQQDFGAIERILAEIDQYAS